MGVGWPILRRPWRRAGNAVRCARAVGHPSAVGLGHSGDPISPWGGAGLAGSTRQGQGQAPPFCGKPHGVVQGPQGVDLPLMNAKLIELAERRTILVARAATQRAELSQALAPWREALAVAHRGW